MPTSHHYFACVAQRARRTCGILLLIFAFAWIGSSRADERQERVLMLHAFNYTFPATTLIGDAARKRLVDRSRGRVEIDADFLDLNRASDPEHEVRTAAFLREKYSNHPPDVIMTLGSAALPFIVKHRDAIAPNTPVVFTGVSQANYSSSQPPPDMTGIITEFNLEKTLILAERLQPNARRLVLIAGNSPTDRLWQERARRIVENRERKLETAYLFGLPYDVLVSKVAKIPYDAIVVVLTVFVDGVGEPHVPMEVARTVAQLSPAPVYAPYDTYLGNGVVGGYIETFESVGSAAADLMLEIIAGKDPATLQPKTNPGQTYRVDFRAMRRWNLRESDLPSDTIILFRESSLWEQHHELVLVALSAFALQTLFVGALLIQQRRRKRAEALLKESEERMTFTAAFMNIGLWQFDRQTGKLWATEHCRALFGLGPDVPLTRETILSKIHPEDQVNAIASVQEASKNDHSAITDVRVTRSDDKVHWVRIRARSHSDNRDAASQMSGIFADITEQKAAEAEAALQRQEVAHLMRVSVLGELSGAIAHEINQPLTAILSNAQAALYLLTQNSPDLGEVRDVLQDIVDEDNRAGEVVHRLRSLLKKGERKFEVVNINDLIKSTIALLNSELISRRVNVKAELANALPSTWGDPIQLQQVLLNLFMNAMDAMGSTPMMQRRVVVFSRAAQTGAVEVLVKDHGSGISAEQDRLFEAFYSTKNHGLGLGLTVCSTIVEAHGGNITLTNDAAGGAVATLSLPAQEMLIAAQ